VDNSKVRSWILLPASLFLISCGGELTGPSAAQGFWRFDASYGACTITAAGLSLQHLGVVWVGRLSGGQVDCNGIPGESSVPVSSMNTGLDDIRVKDDSIAFVLADEPFSARGRIASDSMGGQLEVTTPFCQCTDQYISGTWTVIRLDN
jgi:hypothetical protein